MGVKLVISCLFSLQQLILLPWTMLQMQMLNAIERC